MTTDALIKLCEPLVGRPLPHRVPEFKPLTLLERDWWRDAAVALAKENERLQREVAEWKSLVNQIQS